MVGLFTFTPSDTTNYNTATGTVTVVVSKATPTITSLPTTIAITFGQALSASSLTGGSGSVAGTFTFTTPATIPGAVGNYSASITFTPSDTTSYNATTGTVTVVVNKATPTISALPTTIAITFGQALSASSLSGGSGSVAGTFTFTTPATIPGAVGNYSASITFTPSDTTNYNTATGTVTVVVSKATPTISALPTTIAITFGEALSSSSLSGGSGSVAGTFTFTTPATIPGAVGNYSASITFTPSDTTSYNATTGTVTVVVNKATPTISALPTTIAITFGQALSASSLSGGSGSVAGTFTFTSPATIPGAVGNYSASITFTPSDATSYNATTGTVTVVVNKATPTISALPTTIAITFGQALSSSSLSGGSGSVAGTFTFTTPATIPGAVGNYSASITFTPSDTTSYNATTGTVTVVVNKATPTITSLPTTIAITFGQALSSSSLSGGSGSVAGTFTFSAPATIPGSFGNYSAGITFTPDSANYNSVTSTVTVVVLYVDNAAPVISSFIMPATTAGFPATISDLTVTDDVGVTGYLLSGSATAPLATSPAWVATKPATYTFPHWGNNMLYAFAKDAVGHVSASKSAKVRIGPVDGIIVPSAEDLNPALVDALKALNFALNIETPNRDRTAAR